MDRFRDFLGGRADGELFDHTSGLLPREKRQPWLAASLRLGVKPQAADRLFAGRTLEFHTLWAKDVVSLVSRVMKRANKASRGGTPIPGGDTAAICEESGCNSGRHEGDGGDLVVPHFVLRFNLWRQVTEIQAE